MDLGSGWTRNLVRQGDAVLVPSARPFEIRHVGHTNVESALGWTFTSVPDPEVVFVAGASAGAIASPYYADAIARHYPRAHVVQLGDAAGGYRTAAVSRLLAQWGTTSLIASDSTYSPIDSATMRLETLYTGASRGHSRVRFSQVNAVDDRVQLRYLALLGVTGVPLKSLLAPNLADLHEALPTFRCFTVPGSTHTIIGSPEFYTVSVDGIRLRDWVAGLVEGRPVRDVGDSLLVTE